MRKKVILIAGLRLGRLACTIGLTLLIGSTVDRVLAGTASLVGLALIYLAVLTKRAFLQGAARLTGHECAEGVKAESRQAIVVLHRGQVEEEGTHENLLIADEEYAALFRHGVLTAGRIS